LYNSGLVGQGEHNTSRSTTFSFVRDIKICWWP
jgi:hypothetical protein